MSPVCVGMIESVEAQRRPVDCHPAPSVVNLLMTATAIIQQFSSLTDGNSLFRNHLRKKPFPHTPLHSGLLLMLLRSILDILRILLVVVLGLLVILVSLLLRALTPCLFLNHFYVDLHHFLQPV